MFNKIIGHENYSVSNLGEVKNDSTGRILKQANHSHGYKNIQIGKGNTKYIHRLVAGAFIPNPENKPEVNHKDGNKQNNNVDNLEWVTSSENKQHAESNGLVNHSMAQKKAVSKSSSRSNFENNKAIKIGIDEASEICEAYETGIFSYIEIANNLNVDKSTICVILKDSRC